MTSERRSSKKRSSAKSAGTRGAARERVTARRPGRAVVVAASGGADSAAALLLSRESMPNDRLYAVYVDHGVRPRARIALDVAAVRAQARHAGATVLVRRVKVPRQGVSFEAAAREQRYRALARVAQELGAPIVITGHHRDDVAETMLLALARGSGIDGLAAMRARRPLARGVTLLRPLLRYGKAELREFMRAAGVPVAEDETNKDIGLRRNAVRALLRELERFIPGAGAAAGRSAALLADDASILESLAAAAWRRARVDERSGELAIRSLAALPPALLRRTVRHAVQRALGTLRDFHFEHCDAIARAIAEQRGGSFHAGQGVVELSAGRMSVIAKARSKHAQPKESVIVVPRDRAIARDSSGAVTLQRVQTKSAPSAATLLDADALPAGTRLTLRAAREGDKCIPQGRRTRVPLARFLAKAGVPKHRRKEIVVLCRGEDIVAALGVRVMEPFVARGAHALMVTRGLLGADSG